MAAEGQAGGKALEAAEEVDTPKGLEEALVEGSEEVEG